MSVLDTLITDRTEAEAAAARAANKIPYADMTAAQKAVYDSGRGAYRHTDLNRVGEACAILYEIAQENGYGVPNYVALRTDWAKGERPSYEALEDYITTVSALKAAFLASQTIPSSMRFINYEDANNIEKLLLEVDDILRRIMAVFVRCGVYNSGAALYVKEANA